jgi:hypothetical protein
VFLCLQLLPRFVRLAALGAALAALLAAAGAARAQAGLKAELTEASKQIIKALDGQAVSVGTFVGPRRLQASAGPGIAKALGDELRLQKAVVRDGAPLEVRGTFRDFVDDESGRLAVRINMRLQDRRGKVQLELARAVFPKDARDASLQQLLGANVRLPVAATDEVRDERLRQGLANPSTVINGTRLSAGANSPYAVEVLVKSGGQLVPRAPQTVGGLAFVPLQRKEVYAVRVINNSNFDAAVTLTIDGLNLFAFSQVKDATGDARYSMLILPRKSSATIKGWHLSNNRMSEFVITDLPGSAGGKLKSPSAVGTITATFAAAVPRGSALPADEPKARAADATGIGAQLGARFTEAERVVGAVRDTVSVRYSK